MDAPFVIGPTRGKGRGLFAARALAAGEVIERSPMLVLPHADLARVHATILDDYLFVWENTSAFALGMGGLFNHSYTPNVEYVRDYRTKMLVFETLRDIAAGEELTVNYNGDPTNQDPIWFEPV